MPMRHGADDALTGRSASATGSQRRVSSAFIYENPFTGINPVDATAELFPQRLHRRRVALAGVERLFLSGSPSFRRARHIVLRLTAGPLASTNATHNSLKVESGLRITHCRNRSNFNGSNLGPRPLPLGRAAAEPVSLHRRHSLFT